MTGFAMATTDEELRQMILEVSPTMESINVKVEEAPDLVFLRIPNVPVNIILKRGPVTVTDSEVIGEIFR